MPVKLLDRRSSKLIIKIIKLHKNNNLYETVIKIKNLDLGLMILNLIHILLFIMNIHLDCIDRMYIDVFIL